MLKASVIITLYNKRPYIKRAIESVQKQSVKDIEVIVVNDGSTDDSKKIVESIEDNRIILINQENQGGPSAANKGVRESNSDFITFLDADDEWTENHLESLLRLREKFPEAGAYSSALLTCKDGKNLIKNKYKHIPPSPWEGIIPNYFKSETDGFHPISTIVVGMNKKIFNEMRGFDEKAYWGPDLDLWTRIAIKYPIAFTWDIGAIYHKEVENRMCLNRDPILYHPLIANGKKAIKNNEIPKDMLPYFKEHIAKKEIQIIARNILVGDINTAKKMVKEVETKKYYFAKFKCQVYSQLPNSIYKFIHRWKFIFRPISIL